MKLNLLLCLYFPAVLGSCSGQSGVRPAGGTMPGISTVAAQGDTVPGPGSAITAIYQDSRNNYWFGSRGEGAYRYDGRHILQFTTKQGLVNNDIQGIQEDGQGNIYFDTWHGVSRYDGRSFTTLTAGILPDSVWKLRPGDLWFKGHCDSNGAYRYDGKHLHRLRFSKNKTTDELHAQYTNMPWSPYGIYSMYKDRKGHIWFGTSNLGIYRFDGQSLQQLYEKHLTEIEATGGSFGIRSIIEDKTGKFWFCNTSYRYTILPGNKDSAQLRYSREKGIDLLKPPVYFMSAAEADDGALWMVTYDQGVWRYNGKDISHYAPKDESGRIIKLFSIYKDRQGMLWLGTQEAGAWRLEGNTFKKFRP